MPETPEDEIKEQNGHNTMEDQQQQQQPPPQQQQQPRFVAFGNPLLDIVVNVSEREADVLVRRHNLLRDVGQEINTAGLMHDVMHKK